MKPEIIWNSGPPPRRGVYRVKSDGPSSNIGWRYWFGDHWGAWANRYAWASGRSTRRTPLKYPVLWASKSAPPADKTENLVELLGRALHHLVEHNNEYGHVTPTALIDEIKLVLKGGPT